MRGHRYSLGGVSRVLNHMTARATSPNFTVLDLFCGCGGFSLGFSRAGFEILGGIEIDPVAHQTHSAHFSSKVAPNIPCDIQEVDADQVTKSLCSNYGRERVDVVIGGPPCQPFTRVGRAKLREVAGNIHAHIEDKRVPLFTHFLRFVADLKPLAFVMQNVPLERGAAVQWRSGTEFRDSSCRESIIQNQLPLS